MKNQDRDYSNRQEPFVEVIGWRGPLSQLACRLGCHPNAIRRVAAKNKAGHLVLSVDAPPQLWSRVKRRLEGNAVDGYESDESAA